MVTKSDKTNSNGKGKGVAKFLWCLETFVEYCHCCGKRMSAHGRNEADRIMYAQCVNPECQWRGKEVGYKEAPSAIPKCRCGEDVVVIGARKMSTKHKEGTYVQCENKSCTRQFRVSCYLGEISVKQKPTYPEKQKIVKQHVMAPRYPIGFQGNVQQQAGI